MNKFYFTLMIVMCMVIINNLNAQNIQQIENKAKKHDPTSQMLLGAMYLEGVKVKQNDSLAVYWLQKSANQGLAEAQVMLGNCYKTGKGLEKDSVKAYELYSNAASCGSSYGLEALGDCYYYGINVERDVIRARYYYNQARQRGNKNAMKKYEAIKNKTTQDEIIINL